MTDAAEHVTTDAVAEHVGVTYRRLDYWVRRGYLPIRDDAPGSGSKRRWAPDEVRLAAAFAVLVRAGIDPGSLGEHLDSLLIGDTRFAIMLAGDVVVTGRLP